MNGNPICVLSICDDDGIRYSREMVLESEGYAVQSAASNALLDVANVRCFDIAIICHSVADDQAERLAEKLRRYHPSIRVLRVQAMRSLKDHYYDVDCEALPGPISLLNALKTLCPADHDQTRKAI